MPFFKLMHPQTWYKYVQHHHLVYFWLTMSGEQCENATTF